MDYFDNEQEEIFNFINENSNKKRVNDAEKVEVKDYKIKKVKKSTFKKKAIKFISLATALVLLAQTTYIGVKKVQNEVALNNANHYMNSAINFISPDLDRGVLTDGTVVLFDNDSLSYKSIVENLMNQFGLSRDCAIYCIAEKYGDDAFNKVVIEYGYLGKDNFLYELYAKPTSISSSGETIYSKIGDYRTFENNVQVELVNKVKAIQEMMETKNYESRGIIK